MYEERKLSCIRGYHIYKQVWNPVTAGEELKCTQETINMIDRYPVAILKNEEIIGHLPKKI